MKNANRDTARINPKIKIAAKWLIFVILAVFAYTSSTAGKAGSKALLLFPLALALAVFESEIPAAVFGAAAGLLLDVSLDKLPGFTALWLCVCCAGAAALFQNLLRKNIVNFLWIFALLGGIYLYIDYYFYYKIWAYEGYKLVLTERLIPSALKTLFWSLPVFFAVYILERIFGESRKLELEEQDENIERI